MLLLSSKSLPATALTHLNSVQRSIDGLASFSDKVTAAQDAWKNRTDNAAFREIRQVLLTMCVGTGICNYCENNESTDVEHTFPKSFFPELSFVWENYLLACKTCNSHYKLDKIAVFNPAGSMTIHPVVRTTQPPTQDVLLIHPRRENPLHFIELNLRTGMFLEKPPAGTRDFIRAEYTLGVLALNSRDALREAREARAKDNFRKLQYAVSVAEATDFDTLDTIINDNEPFITLDTTQPLPEVKAVLLANIRKAIVHAPHPTVWVEMQQQQAHIPKIADLFNRLPEALTW